MKSYITYILVFCLILLSGCGAKTVATPEVTEELVQAETPETVPQVEPEVEPEAEPEHLVTLFLPNANVDGYDQVTVDVDLNPDLILAQLVEQGGLPQGTEFLSFSNDDGHLSMDLTQVFGDAVCSTGTTGELMLMGCLVNTFLTAYDAQSVAITVEGSTLETGHTVYDFLLTFFGDSARN